jgi:hypothetical protein
MAGIQTLKDRHHEYKQFDKYSNIVLSTIDPNMNLDKCSEDLLIERKILRLVQSLSDSSSSNPLISVGFHAVGVLSTSPMPHSCLPTLSLEIVVKPPGSSSISYLYMALHDTSDDELSVSHLSSPEAFVAERRSQLSDLFGPDFTCSCLKCLVENTTGVTLFYNILNKKQRRALWCLVRGYGDKELKRLAHVYMQEQQFTATLNICTLLLQQSGKGDTYHLMGGALLSLGRWSEANEVWAEGLLRAPTHLQLREECEKHDSYLPSISQNKIDQNQLSDFQTYTINNEPSIFVSIQPLLSRQEAREVVSLAEGFADTGEGWSTSRHYAVPTTDIPVHSCPALLVWFNELMRSRLYSVLSQQFCRTAVSRIHVHDAFVVKYHVSEEGPSQRSLPLHSDESTHSFVLALNDEVDYVGGGTYFVDLGESIRPGQE